MNVKLVLLSVASLMSNDPVIVQKKAAIVHMHQEQESRKQFVEKYKNVAEVMAVIAADDVETFKKIQEIMAENLDPDVIMFAIRMLGDFKILNQFLPHYHVRNRKQYWLNYPPNQTTRQWDIMNIADCAAEADLHRYIHSPQSSRPDLIKYDPHWKLIFCTNACIRDKKGVCQQHKKFIEALACRDVVIPKNIITLMDSAQKDMYVKVLNERRNLFIKFILKKLPFNCNDVKRLLYEWCKDDVLRLG